MRARKIKIKTSQLRCKFRFQVHRKQRGDLMLQIFQQMTERIFDRRHSFFEATIQDKTEPQLPNGQEKFFG